VRYRIVVSTVLVLFACVTSIVLPLQRASAADPVSVLEERAIRSAVERVAPSVVRIETVGGSEKVGKMLVGTGPTTGLIVSADGYIVSSAFSFAQQPDSILVTLPSGNRQAAKLVATDHSRLLVLLKVDASEQLIPAIPVPQNEVRVGQWAVAVGRVFEAQRPNVSVGIVSAVGRIWGKAIQTDAKISPNNYGGPLIDIAGRVLGVLVPMSPQGGGELAGVEWYDSGIGFAIPLETVLSVLPQWREGKDLYAGLLGISLKGKDLFSDAAVIAAAATTGPAYKAGFRVADKIIEIGGKPIVSEAQLKHALGPQYAGATVKIVALRGDQRIEHDIQLAEKIDPFVVPFLGILPLRTIGKPAAAGEPGVVVRYVYPGSPAANIGLQPGDRLTSFAGKKVTSADGMTEPMQSLAPGEKVTLEVARGSETLTLSPQLTTLPEALPGELPPAYDPVSIPTLGDAKPAVGVVPIKLPEFENKCIAYVPEDYNPAVPHGVVVWLHAPGGFKQEELVELWKPLCEKYDLILLAPQSTDPTKWLPTETRFVRRVLDSAMKTYSIDPARVVVHGQEGGGTLAYIVALVNLDVVRAVAAVDAPLPRVSQLPQPDPLHRLAFYTTLATDSTQAIFIEAGIEKLREAKYPVTVQNVGETPRSLNAEELESLVRWFDTLDRL
jgi:serine protease Do